MCLGIILGDKWKKTENSGPSKNGNVNTQSFIRNRKAFHRNTSSSTVNTPRTWSNEYCKYWYLRKCAKGLCFGTSENIRSDTVGQNAAQFFSK